MSPEDREVYEMYLDMFLHPGWKHLVEDLAEWRGPILDLRNSKDIEDLHANKGKLEVIDYIINLPDIVDNAYKEDEADEDL